MYGGLKIITHYLQQPQRVLSSVVKALRLFRFEKCLETEHNQNA